MNLDSFRLTSLVVHDVPQPDEERKGLILTDAEIPLDAQLRGYFERKITQRIINRGLEAIADPSENGTVRDGVASILADQTELVPVSKTFAEHLDHSQTRRNPAGLLAVGLGRVEEGASSPSSSSSASRGFGCGSTSSEITPRSICSSSAT